MMNYKRVIQKIVLVMVELIFTYFFFQYEESEQTITMINIIYTYAIRSVYELENNVEMPELRKQNCFTKSSYH